MQFRHLCKILSVTSNLIQFSISSKQFHISHKFQIYILMTTPGNILSIMQHFRSYSNSLFSLHAKQSSPPCVTCCCHWFTSWYFYTNCDLSSKTNISLCTGKKWALNMEMINLVNGAQKANLKKKWAMTSTNFSSLLFRSS